MKAVIVLLLLLGVSLAQVQTHYYNTGGCEPRAPSEYSVEYQPSACYRNREVTSDCATRWECLRRNLEWNDFESCLGSNGTTVVRSGSFQVVSGNHRLEFETNDCTGSFEKFDLEDSCEAQECGVIQVVHYPILHQNSDDDDLDAGQIAGITLGSLAIITVCLCGSMLILTCCCCGVLFVASVVGVIIMMLYAVLNTEDINSSGQTTLKGRLLTFMNKCWNDFCNKIAGEKMN